MDKLTDIQPIVMKPTHINNRIERKGLSKILDHFLVFKELLHKINKYISWLDSNGGSHQKHIFLQVENVDEKPSSPLKNNNDIDQVLMDLMGKQSFRSLQWES